MSRAGARFRSGTRTNTWTQRPTSGNPYGVATGGIGSAQSTGTLADGFTYNYLTFTSTGTLTVTKAGFFDVLLFGGGGSGGGGKDADSQAGGGGGGGGILQTSVYLSANTTVTIGAGGVSTGANSVNGGDTRIGTTLGTLVCIGGGGGRGWYPLGGDWTPSLRTSSPALSAHSVGGSGGGQGSTTLLPNSSGYGLAFVDAVTGYAGGTSSGYGCGGGGGAGGAGSNAPSSGNGGNGGAGYDVSAFIGGSALYKAAGGGGAGSSSAGSGGSSIGGNGSTSGNGTAASANTASGGGGGRYDAGPGGSGGSGIVYVRFRV